MADRGFLIEDDLKQFNVQLNIPAFLEGQTIASVRIHVERAIQGIKKFKILRNSLNITWFG